MIQALLGFLPWSRLVKPLTTWIGIIAGAAVIGSVFLYIKAAERNRMLVNVLEDESAAQVALIAERDRTIDGLNQRITLSNARWLELVKRERERVRAANLKADQVRQQRDAITAQLSAARLEWIEALKHDEYLAEFVAIDVPAAVWQRLRRSTGEVNADQ